MRNKIFVTAVFASFAWNLYLVGGVMLNASYALDRDGSPNLEVFPIYIRIIYILYFALIVYQVVIFTRFSYGIAIKSKWTVKAFVILGVLGIFDNAVRRTTIDRWNVIPALIITFAFYRILKSEPKRTEITA
ncbi:MAG: hypothetical protein D4S00_06050 [Streptomycetaceae bacterium]|nr:MAG: hypothetical protein D4S00_06050 [Streptomycetaceae bacterium]